MRFDERNHFQSRPAFSKVTAPTASILVIAALLSTTVSASIAQEEPAARFFIADAGIERFCEGDFLSSASVHVRDYAERWSKGRRIIVRYNHQHGSAELVPPERRGGTVDDFAFPSRVNPDGHLSTRQYARLVDEWVTAIGLPSEEYGTHSLRRTKASLIYKATGNLRAIQILLGHSKIENTVRYLGVDVDDALSLSEATEI